MEGKLRSRRHDELSKSDLSEQKVLRRTGWDKQRHLLLTSSGKIDHVFWLLLLLAPTLVLCGASQEKRVDAS